MDTLVRVILAAVYLLALRLGIKMALHKAGRGRVTTTKGYTIWRTILVAIIAIVWFWYVVLPHTIPEFLSAGLPMATRVLGLIFFALGSALRVWSQLTIGSAWSADISLGDHLVTSGPYSWVRHPIYASYLIIAPSLLAMTDNWLLGLLSSIYALVSVMRISQEEELLGRFGDRYEKYRSQVPGTIFPKHHPSHRLEK